jgi:hypothetical protein
MSPPVKAGRISSLAKLIAIQAVVLLIASNLAGFIGSSILHAIGKKQTDRDKLESAKRKAERNYFNSSKAYRSYGLFFKDLTNFNDYPYRSFIGWRLEKIRTPSINIDQTGVRKTPILSPIQSNEKVWLIGGSTVWGYTTADDETIPSYFQKLTSSNVTNLGEQAYTSRQSLNFLLNELVKARLDGSFPTLVVAYEGVNDSIFPCFTEANHPFVHGREDQIQSALTAAKREHQPHEMQIKFTAYNALLPGVTKFRNELSILRGPNRTNPSESSYKHCLSKEYAKKVAFNTVQNWELTHSFLQSIGIRYYAILQPSPYQDPAYKGTIDINYKSAITLIYPLIQQYAKGKPWFIDGSDWFLNYGKPAWVDSCCHTNPEANRFIAEQIVKQLSLRQGL